MNSAPRHKAVISSVVMACGVCDRGRGGMVMSKHWIVGYWEGISYS